jgi:hypothetical protein
MSLKNLVSSMWKKSPEEDLECLIAPPQKYDPTPPENMGPKKHMGIFRDSPDPGCFLPPLEVRKSRIHGVGLFTTRDVKKGERIIPLDGNLYELTDEESARPEYDNWFGVGMFLFVEPTNELVYINHSCKPSTGLDEEFWITAMRDIPKGGEVTFDYAINERVMLWHMRCRCREENCREFVSAVQTIPEFVVNRYAKLIPPFFRAVYAAYQKRIKS